MVESFPAFWNSLNNFLTYKIGQIGVVVITPRKIAVALFAIWFFNMLSYFVERTIHRTLARKDFDPGAKTAIERFARYGVFTIGILITLSYVGINLRALESFGAVLGVGLGFGLQNITQNFISGLILLTERPIKRGDIVDLDGTTGRVLDVRARSTLVLTRDDVVIIVPNSEFITKQVINQSFSGDKIRYSISIGVAYGSDVEKVRDVLLSIAENHPQILKSPPPSVSFKNFGDSALEFELFIWLSDLWFYGNILSELRFEIDKKFKDHDISIPFPQMDIHVKALPREKRN